MRFIVSQLMTALLLAGCVSSPPKKARVEEAPVPEAWASDAIAAGGVREDWWTTLGSEELSACVLEALANNHDLKMAVARLDAAMAQARIAGADLYPSLGFGFDATRRQQVFVGLPIPGRENEPLKSLSTTYGANFNLSWELDLWGRIRSGRSAALAEVQASATDLRGTRESIAGQTARAWVAAVETRRQLELAEETASNFGATARQIQQRYEFGIGSPLEVRLARSNEESAKALVVQWQAEHLSAVRALEILMGRYPGAALAPSQSLPDVEGMVPAGLPSELLERRPDLAAAERRLAAMNMRVREAKAALFPRISLTTTGGRTSSELEDLLSSQFNVWSLAGNLAQPLFQGGRLWANVQLNRARATEALEQYLQTTLQAFGEVETALTGEQLLADRESALKAATEQSLAARRLAEDRYRNGLEEFVTLLEAQRRALDAESQWIAVRRLRMENRINLHLALGGGFRQMEDDEVRGEDSLP